MMKKEMELKFIVDETKLCDVVKEAFSRISITQGYLFGTHIRVRNIIDTYKGKTSVITIKGDREGVSRDEFEYEIPYEEGVILLEKFATDAIVKTRYLIKRKKDTWEVDYFHGKNFGLILAEIEIPREDYDVDLPDWLLSNNDVSDDERYYNYYLAKNPYSEWFNERE